MSEADIAELVDQHHRNLYRYGFRLTGSAADAEDLVQEAFLIGQQKLGQLRSRETAGGWLIAILRGCFIRKQRQFSPVPAGDLQLDIESVPDEAWEGERIDTEQLQKALDRLTPAHRIMLAMFYFEDISYRQIAEQLDIPIGTVMSRLARAKSRLKAEICRDEREPSSRHRHVCRFGCVFATAASAVHAAEDNSSTPRRAAGQLRHQPGRRRRVMGDRGRNHENPPRRIPTAPTAAFTSDG